MSCPEPCAACPWRVSNHGTRHPHGFYTKRNLQRLWNQIRRGGRAQSCHPTDPGHPDHGAKPEAEAKECVGSVILVMREMKAIQDDGGDGPAIDRYLERSKKTKGLTRDGLNYFSVRSTMDPKLPPAMRACGLLLPPVTETQIDDDSYGRLGGRSGGNGYE